MRKRMQAKLQAIQEGLRRRWHLPVPEVGRWLQAVVGGYFRYHAVPWNSAALQTFRNGVVRLWHRALRRRSQKSRIPWTRMRRLADQWLPRPRILHPYPSQRLTVRTQGRSPVR
jgi:hypothetical protein